MKFYDTVTQEMTTIDYENFPNNAMIIATSQAFDLTVEAYIDRWIESLTD
jgi:hypothetical protein